MRVMKLIAILSIAISFSGCAVNKIRVTYYSDPPGAILYDGERRLGFAPYSLTYKVSKQQRIEGKVLLDTYGPRVAARWKSGARAEVAPGRYFDISKTNIFNADEFYSVLKRPADHPDLEGDLANGEYVTEMQRIEARARAAAAEAAEARAAADAAAKKSAQEREAAESANYRNRLYGF